MPFTYEAPTPRFAATIAEMIAHAADPQAQSARDIAQAHAQAIQQSGNAWANAGQQIGQAIGQIPQQIERAKQQQQETQYKNAQIADMAAQQQQREAAAKKQQSIEQSQRVVDTLMQQSMKTDPDTGVVTFDRPTFEQQLLQSGQGHLYPQMAETLDKLDASAASRNEKGRSMLAHALVGIEQAGYTPGSMLTAAAYLKANHLATDDHLKPIYEALSNDPSPDAVKGIVANLSQMAPGEYQALHAAEEKRVSDLAHVGAETAQAQTAADKNKAEVAGTLPQKPNEVETARHNAEMERIDALRVGKQEAAEKETARHNLAMESKTGADDALTKVEHKDPDTGRTVIEWLPKSSLAGRTFQKGTSGATETRLASAEAVNQTGKDIISKLSDPAYAAKVGPVMGRAGKLRDLIGNPPPEFAELAGEIESYALANMGVHGMRSAQGAAQIAKLLEQHHTPASLIAAINGLNGFSEHFMQNEGRPVPATPATPPPKFSVGDTVSVGGKKVKISAIHPDGSFDGSDVK